MSVISGNDHVYDTSEILSNKESVIERNGLTHNSTDIINNPFELTSSYGDSVGSNVNLKIWNNSAYEINITVGTGITMKPGPIDTILPDTLKRYLLVITGPGTINIFNMDYNGTPIVTEKIITNVIERETELQPVNFFNNVTEVIQGLDVSNGGDLNVYGNIFSYVSVAELPADSDITYTAGQLLGGFIKRTTRKDHIDTLPSAVDIISAMGNPRLGTSFHCYINNSRAKKLRIRDGIGTTISGTDRDFSRYSNALLLFTVTNLESGSESVVCYVMGVLKDAKNGDSALITDVDDENYTVLESDSTINVDTKDIKNICTVTLPEISTIGQKRYHITDSTGNAGRYNIKIVTSGFDKIMGTKSVTINSNYSSVSMYNNEVDNWILY